MSSEPQPDRALESYVLALLAAIDAHDAAAGLRIRELAGSRTARISLDDEVVLTQFVAGQLQVQADDPTAEVHGQGATDRGTVVDLLTGRLEAGAALLAGRLEIAGEPDEVAAMLQIIDILLDAAARAPALQLLERELRASFVAPPSAATSPSATSAPAWYPDQIPADELALLARLDLLRDGPDP